MLEYTIGAYRNNPNYEVRVMITYSRLKPNSKEAQDALDATKRKLEKIIPTTFKARYLTSFKELIILVKAENASRSQSTIAKMTEYVQEAVRAVEREMQR